MDSFNWFVQEMLSRETMREHLEGFRREQPKAPTRQNPITRTLASSLVRLGLRLDPAAGEDLGALDLSLAQPEGRN